MNTSGRAQGVFFGAASHTLWGVLPLYWKLLSPVNALHILGFRILCSLGLIACLLLPRKNTRWIDLLKDPKKRLLVLGSACMVTVNWGLYIWAVNAGHAVDASLGYYINPLLSVILGLIFFRERLSPLQWAAFGCAVLGVVLVTAFTGIFPWIALGLALSFGLYGLLKKKIDAGSLEVLGAETLLASPLALLLIFFGGGGLEDFRGLSPRLWVLLLFAGAVTTAPLYCFARGTKLLPLSAMGFIQFINPSILLLIGIFLFGEPFPPAKIPAFACIWTAVALYVISLFLDKKSRPGEIPPGRGVFRSAVD
ncbi:MAG: EamA family transporter RarD [Treponema sp.]|jgi:chloramphenicol-sensitive protein RarD|nr:EamA family transporter RarD [Treponema sp.]